ncbi:MarR family winged helix-turn-helix transcriptional regulator [Xanthobacter sp. AM11]|uniref:MarR family winged helix-turn-helix transcriptional regulator n=1 Tax=Xanthobacter sp. AM11 TaxID=3380643 RepID=UPI0039BEF68A
MGAEDSLTQARKMRAQKAPAQNAASAGAAPVRRGRKPMRAEEPDDVDDVAEASDLDLTGLTSVVGYTLRRAQMAVFEDFSARFATLDLTPAQYSVLLVIADNPGRKQSEIARVLGIQRTNFVVMLDQLEKRGLAERTRSATDARSHAVFLTKAGKTLLKNARKIQSAQEEDFATLLGPGGRDTLVALLRKVARID